MNIGYFTPNYPGITGEGGIGTYTRDLAQTLCRSGHAVHVLTPGVAPSVVQDGAVSVHVIRTSHIPGIDRVLPGAGACLHAYREMTRIVKQQHLDIVEFPNWEGRGSLFSCWRSVPLVVRLSTSSHETQVIDGTRQSRTAGWDVRREKWQARHADAVVTHSLAHRQNMANELGIAADRIAAAPLGIQVFPEFSRAPSSSATLTVLFVGRMEKRKGTLDLLHAIPKVLDEVPNARFIFIGSDRPHCPHGLTHAEYVRRTYPDSIGRRIELLGRLPDQDVVRWMQSCDLFVAPSLYESFGLVFLEAMRWGTPAVGTTAGGIPEIIDDGSTGILIQPGNSAALAKALTTLLRDGARRRALGEAGRRKVESQFSLEKMSQRAQALYADVIATWRSQRRFQFAARHPKRSASAVPAHDAG